MPVDLGGNLTDYQYHDFFDGKLFEGPQSAGRKEKARPQVLYSKARQREHCVGGAL